MADFPCNNRECSEEDHTSDTWLCDPTQPDWCAGTDARCDPYREFLCVDGVADYTVVEFNKTLHYETIPTLGLKYYVYRAVDPCRYIAYRNYPIWGDPSTDIVLLEDLPTYIDGAYEEWRTLREAGFFGPDLASICPGQYDFPFKVGTHVAVVYPFDSLITATGPPGSNYTLSIGDRAYPPEAPLANNGAGCTVPAEASTWTEPDGSPITEPFTCLDDSIPMIWNTTGPPWEDVTRYFTYTVPLGQCQNLYWVQNAGGAFIGYAFGDDVKVPYESTNYAETDWNLVNFGGNPGGNFLEVCSNATHNYHLIIKVGAVPTFYFRTPDLNMNMFYIDSTPGYRYLEKIADKEPYIATWDLQMSSQLRCTDRETGELTKRVCNFRLPLNDDESECYRFWQYYPSERPIPIFPLPAWLFEDVRFVNYYPDILPTKSNGRQYFSASLIQFQPDITQSPLKVHGNYPTSAALDSCQMTFMGSIVDVNGKAVDPKPFSFTTRQPECKYEEYQAVLPQIKEVGDKLTNAESPSETRNARVSVDILTYSKPYADCIKYANSLVNTKPVTREVLTSVCNPETSDPSDPCCNPNLAWNGTDCNARRLSYSVARFDSLSSAGKANCRVKGKNGVTTSECSAMFASDYITSSENARSSLEGCGVNTPIAHKFRGEQYRDYRRLSDHWLGADPAGLGHPCQMDSECNLLQNDKKFLLSGEPNVTCDLLRGVCKYPIARLFENFLTEWIPTLTYYVRSVTAEQIGVPLNQISSAAAWINALSKDNNDCTGKYTWGYGYRRSYGRYVTLQSNAVGCRIGQFTDGEDYCPERFCTLAVCTVPFQCQASSVSNSLCWTGFSKLPFLPSNCTRGQELSKTCNWALSYAQPNFTIPGSPLAHANPTDCTAQPNVCAVCETDSETPCLGFPTINSESTCTSSYACFLANGTRVITSSVAACEAILSCNSTCYANDGKTLVPCENQSQCEGDSNAPTPTLGSGTCDTIVWSFRDLGGANTYRPACVVPPQVWWSGANGDCTARGLAGDEYGRPTPYGCMYYKYAATHNCSEVYGETAFEWKFFTTQSECERQTGCWQIIDELSRKNDHTWSHKNAADCAAIGGETKPLSNWHAGVWRGGIARPMTWLPTKSDLIQYPMQKTFNLLKFGTGLQYAIDSAYSIPQVSETYCRYNTLRQALGPVLCTCAPDGAKDESCFQADAISSGDAETDAALSASATATICEGSGYTTETAAPVRVTFDRRTVSGCAPAYINIHPSSNYAQNSGAALSTFLLDFTVSRPYQFVNKNGALVGQILGDGVIVKADFELRNITICTNPFSGSKVTNKHYNTYDFAKVWIGDDAIETPQPMYLRNAYYNKDADAVCGTIERLDGDHAYYPIIRLKNAETKKKNDFPAGEAGFYGIMCILYLAAAILAAWRFLATVLAGTFAPRNTQVWIFLTICVMMSIRALYIILILAGVVIGNSSSAIDYFLVELPSFLYLTIMTFFIIIWATLIRVNRKLSRRRNNANFWGIFFLINAIIYAIFIILIIIYESVKPKRRTLCGGRLVTIDQTVRRNTAIAYRAILAGIALIISISFFVTGSRIYLSLRGASNARASRKRKIFWLTCVCSVGLLGVSTLLIVLAASGKQNNYVALALLVVFEIIPCSVILASLWNVDQKEKLSDTGNTTGKSTTQMRSLVTSDRTSSTTGRSSTTDTDDDIEEAAPATNGHAKESSKSPKKSRKQANGKNSDTASIGGD